MLGGCTSAVFAACFDQQYDRGAVEAVRNQLQSGGIAVNTVEAYSHVMAGMASAIYALGPATDVAQKSGRLMGG